MPDIVHSAQEAIITRQDNIDGYERYIESYAKARPAAGPRHNYFKFTHFTGTLST
jgi:hypothetical protein